MPNTIDNTEDIIDSRDIIARIAELESTRDSLIEARDDADVAFADLPLGDTTDDTYAAVFMALQTAKVEARQALDEWYTGDEGEEFEALVKLQEQAAGYLSDWHHGEALIRDSYFEDYARDTAEDIYGKELGQAKWPFSCIDWEQAARELQQDYTAFEFGGVTYWGRS